MRSENASWTLSLTENRDRGEAGEGREEKGKERHGRCSSGRWRGRASRGSGDEVIKEPSSSAATSHEVDSRGRRRGMERLSLRDGKGVVHVEEIKDTRSSLGNGGRDMSSHCRRRGRRSRL
jgi:hypothetical protein